MKVIFLDIDGVLVTPESIYKSKKHYLETGEMISSIDEDKLDIIKEIIEKTNAKIVLSSLYKLEFIKDEQGNPHPITDKTKLMESLFNKHSLKIFDLTPNDYYRNRSKEILMYLRNNSIDNFVIIDDEGVSLSEVFPDNFIKINTPYDYQEHSEEDIGLKPKHIKEAIRILTRNK